MTKVQILQAKTDTDRWFQFSELGETIEATHTATSTDGSHIARVIVHDRIGPFVVIDHFDIIAADVHAWDESRSWVAIGFRTIDQACDYATKAVQKLASGETQ